MKLSAVLLLASMGFAQAASVSIGVKGGVPLNDAFETIRGNDAAFVTNTKRYTVGGTIEVHLPARFSIEVDALYRRLGFEGTATGVPGTTFTRARSWEFPILGKFEITGGGVRPFVDLGLNIRRITDLRQFQQTVDGEVVTQVIISEPQEFNKETDLGLAAGFGIAFKAGSFRISPEFRFTRWGGENFRDPVGALLRTNRNDGTFLLGITF